jgi:hypothetical protein
MGLTGISDISVSPEPLRSAKKNKRKRKREGREEERRRKKKREKENFSVFRPAYLSVLGPKTLNVSVFKGEKGEGKIQI